MRCRFILGVLALSCSLYYGAGFAAVAVIDDFDYSTDDAAQAAWNPSKDSPEVRVSESGQWGDEKVLVLPLVLEEETDRNYWDREIELDLSETPNFSLRLFVEDPALITRFTLYFLSPGGWVSSNVTVEESGWQTLEWTQGEFWEEDGGFDWKKVQRIRLSAWKKAKGESFLALDRLAGYAPPVVVVKGWAERNSGNAYYANRMATMLGSILEGLGVPHGIITDRDVENGMLDKTSLALFPFNVNVSEE